MTNRQKYITRCNEFDMMLKIRKSTVCICPIRAVKGEFPANNRCKASIEDCKTCIQKWLNNEEDKQ